MEEIVQALFEQGTLVGDGAVRLTTPVGEIRIPSTVQGILAARIDRLPPAEKDLLQTLAVIGRQFPLGLVRDVSGKSDDEVERMLGALRLGEFIYEQPAVGDVEYIFKHALTQEVAYNSLLSERRKAIHLRAGAAIESSFAGRLEDHHGELAHHYVRGGENRKAIHYLSLAAYQDLERAAYTQALEHTTTGLELLAALPADSEHAGMELDLVLGRGIAVLMQQGPGEESAAYGARACELARRLDRPRDLSRALAGLIIYQISQNREAARQLAQEGISIGRRVGDSVNEASHRSRLGIILYLSGDLSGARENCEQALAALKSEPHTSWSRRITKANCITVLCQVLWHQGFPDQALRRCREMSGMEQELSDPAMFGIVLAVAATVAILCGEQELAHELVSALTALTEEHSLSFRHVALTSFLNGWLLILDNDLMEGIALMRKARSIWNAHRHSVGISLNAAFLAGAHAMARQEEEGLRVIDEALPLVEQFDDRLYEPELWRLRGELLVMQRFGRTLKLACARPSRSPPAATPGRWNCARR
jgi:tetratricopeptide (TPR) repeat protein